MAKRDTEEFLEGRLEAIREQRQRAQFEMRRVREEIEALDAEDFGLRRALAEFHGEDPSAVQFRRSVPTDEVTRWNRIRLMEQERQLLIEERSRLAHEGVPSIGRVERIVNVPPPQSAKRQSRGDAVEEILNRADRPLDRREILTRLLTFGRLDENLDGVSATLSHLRRTGRAISADGGWTTPARYEQLKASTADDRDRAETPPTENADPNDPEGVMQRIATETRQRVFGRSQSPEEAKSD